MSSKAFPPQTITLNRNDAFTYNLCFVIIGMLPGFTFGIVFLLVAPGILADPLKLLFATIMPIVMMMMCLAFMRTVLRSETTRPPR